VDLNETNICGYGMGIHTSNEEGTPNGGRNSDKSSSNQNRVRSLHELFELASQRSVPGHQNTTTNHHANNGKKAKYFVPNALSTFTSTCAMLTSHHRTLFKGHDQFNSLISYDMTGLTQ
jgi:hypothetical protein